MLFFASVVLSLLLGFAADLTITVNVSDTSGKPVSGVMVLLESTTDQKKWESVTADSGTVHFDRLQIGSYVIRIIKDGYYPGDVDLRAEASKVVDFTLTAIETRHEEVEVIARPEPINADAVAAQQDRAAVGVHMRHPPLRRWALGHLSLGTGGFADFALSAAPKTQNLPHR